MTRKFRQCAKGPPFRCALRQRLRLHIGAAFGNPPPQLLGGRRTVDFAVRSDDSVHEKPFSKIARLDLFVLFAVGNAA